MHIDWKFTDSVAFELPRDISLGFQANGLVEGVWMSDVNSFCTQMPGLTFRIAAATTNPPSAFIWAGFCHPQGSTFGFFKSDPNISSSRLGFWVTLHMDKLRTSYHRVEPKCLTRVNAPSPLLAWGGSPHGTMGALCYDYRTLSVVIVHKEPVNIRENGENWTMAFLDRITFVWTGDYFKRINRHRVSRCMVQAREAS